ncbi:aminopeptidase [Caproiciproducens faecalis]|uniref:Aminopeptidase n=1 Tax=Caproiciproducens faecalis TaxID=2820301 RepID=A0ABS7DM47_9FIRM|nr:aminopeptidase [Caproiciproducens faecalis]MBW7572379.1 aminopeptidase [Caproiciproducens faecalis]
MNIELVKKLSNADAVASHEDEVRSILLEELKNYSDEVDFDRLGSAIFHKKGDAQGPRVMVCAHMDEVGFLVRSISKIGMLYVIPVGSVRTFSKFMQGVRVTTQSGKKIPGILNSVYADGDVKDLVVDIGAVSEEEALALGIRVGDMVTFSSECQEYGVDGTFAGKAFDDRLGCYVMAETLKRLSSTEIPNQLFMAATSSEEVGLRGGKTSAYKIQPDIVIVLDVACWGNELVRDHTNNRQIGRGPMLLHYDKTLVPSSRLVNHILKIADENGIALQQDMFSNGGTDGGQAHLSRDGAVCAVLGIPLRYGHSPWSIGSAADVDNAVLLLTELLKSLDKDAYLRTVDFAHGRQS